MTPLLAVGECPEGAQAWDALRPCGDPGVLRGTGGFDVMTKSSLQSESEVACLLGLFRSFPSLCFGRELFAWKNSCLEILDKG